MDDAATPDAPYAPPPVVSIAPFSPSARRLSATFVNRTRPVPSERSPLAWISLQGRLENAEVASSARTVGLIGEQALAWELFTPIQRFLLVAVIGVAVAESKKNQQIWNLKKSVELRDQVLSSMQQKLDDICEQLNSTKEQSTAAFNKLPHKDGELQLNESFGAEKIKFVDCGCWHCEEHSGLFNELVQGASVTRVSNGNEVLQYKIPFSAEEPEERRMSDLSDWASSVTSAADIQLNALVVDQDIYNLKRDCEEKDATIKELTTVLNTSKAANYNRVAELEDIIRRKNSSISKLKKDLVVLEQKVVQLSRQRRPSFSAANDSNGSSPLPQMRDNLIYDMDNTTSPSSSDSDTSTPVYTVKDVPQKSTPAKILSTPVRALGSHTRSRSVSPLREVSTNRKSSAASSSQKQLSARGDLKKSRRRSLGGAKSATANKRWV